MFNNQFNLHKLSKCVNLSFLYKRLHETFSFTERSHGESCSTPYSNDECLEDLICRAEGSGSGLMCLCISDYLINIGNECYTSKLLFPYFIRYESTTVVQPLHLYFISHKIIINELIYKVNSNSYIVSYFRNFISSPSHCGFF